MEELAVLLDHILRCASMDIGRIRYAAGTAFVTFDDGPQKNLSPSELREMLAGGRWDVPERLQAESARLVIPVPLVEELTDMLRKVLAAYVMVEDSLLRHVFPASGAPSMTLTFEPSGLVRHAFISSISDFARSLIRASVILGSKHVAALLYDWIDGRPLIYRTSVVLVGVTVDQEIDMPNGVSVSTLSQSSNALPDSFPRNLPVQDYLGRTLLSVATTVSPVLSSVRDGETKLGDTHTLSSPNIVSVSALCDALSLVTGSCVGIMRVWLEYSGLEAFTDKPNTSSWSIGQPAHDRVKPVVSTSHSTGTVTLLRREPVAPTLTLANLQKAWSIHSSLDDLVKNDRRFNTAVKRWIRSTRPDLNITDHVIDLRIALEALYLDNDIGELAFRLATRGAWHLGRDPSERSEIYEILKKFYSIASRVIHAGKIKENEGNRKWIDKARSTCRRGILLYLENEQQPEWDNVIMGHDSGQPSGPIVSQS